MAIVYQHRRKDTNEVFYIGISKTKDRAYNKSNRRNKYWHRIVNKYGYKVDILIDGCSWEDACEVEKGLIKEYGRADLGLGLLVNMTDGGDGTQNFIHNEISKIKIGNYWKNKKRGKQSKDHRDKMILSKIKNKTLRGWHKGEPRPNNTKNKIREKILGKIKITNKIVNLYWDKDKDIPEGFIKGFTKNSDKLIINK